MSVLSIYHLFFYGCGYHRDLHSFPTRRSSDLRGEALRRRHVRQPFGESLPAPQILEAEEHQRRETGDDERSEEHTSELQSPDHLVCRLLLEKKKSRNSLLVVMLCHTT